MPTAMTPQHFREQELVIEDGRQLHGIIAPFQRERFALWDNHDRVYIESCTGSSKSTDIAGWCLSYLAQHKDCEGFIYAVDRDQARRIVEQARGFRNRNPRLGSWVDIDREGRIKRMEVIKGEKKRREPRGFIEVESSDVASAEGIIADVVICEQMESWPREELWEAIISRAHKRQMKVLIIANACHDEDGWQYKVREMAREDDRWEFMQIDVDEVPWITEDDKTEMLNSLRPATYERLYKNIAGAAEESMFTGEQVDAMIQERLHAAPKRPADVVRVALALDLGLKHDLSVLTALGEFANGDQVLLDMEAWQGSREYPVNIEGVEEAIKQYWDRFRPNVVLADPWQTSASIQNLQKGYRKITMEEFIFGTKNIANLTRQLWRRGVDCRLAIYKDAGVTHRKTGQWDLARELKSVKLVEGAHGFKLETRGNATKDRTISLGMASWWLADTYVYGEKREWVTVSEEEDEEYIGRREMGNLDF
jgi:hypothetical protein